MTAAVPADLLAACRAFFADGDWHTRRGVRRAANGELVDRLEAALGVRALRGEDRRMGQHDRATFVLDGAGRFIDAPGPAAAAAEAARLVAQGGAAHHLVLLLSDVGPFAYIYGNLRRLRDGRVAPTHFFAASPPPAAAAAFDRLVKACRDLGLALPDEELLAAPVRVHPDYPGEPDTPADLRAHLFGEY